MVYTVLNIHPAACQVNPGKLLDNPSPFTMNANNGAKASFTATTVCAIISWVMLYLMLTKVTNERIKRREVE